jgi:hypothetical protein
MKPRHNPHALPCLKAPIDLDQSASPAFDFVAHCFNLCNLRARVIAMRAETTKMHGSR